MAPVKVRRSTRWLALTVTILAGFAGGVVLREPLLRGLGHWLVVGGKPANADYVFVMPGGDATRPFVAAGMVRRKMARGVLVPRTVDSPETLDGIMPPNHETIRAILIARGATDEQVVFLDKRQSDSSWGDALALGEFLETHPGDRVAVVTNDYHTRRSRWSFCKVLGPKADQVFFVSAPVDEFGPDDWWQYEDGIHSYLSEYAKLGYYWVRYDRGLIWVGMVLILGGAGGAYAARKKRRVASSE